MMRQYREMKDQHPDAVLLFQLGDFYETFYDDATLAARELDITLTARDGVPMAGIPVRKTELYVQRLLKRGHKVALCPQVERSGKGQTLLRRRVIRVLTPGTVLEEEGLQAEQDTLLAALYAAEGRLGVAWVEAASGQFAAEEVPQAQLSEVVARLEAQEWLMPNDWSTSISLTGTLTQRPQEVFADTPLKERFPRALAHTPLAARAAGALLTYLEETVGSLPHLRPPALRDSSMHMLLDGFTQRSLELTAPLRGQGGPTVLSVVDRTHTSMGRRLLRRWLVAPLRRVDDIQERLNAVQALLELGAEEPFKDSLKQCCDMPRLVGRAGLSRLFPPDLAALRRTLQSARCLADQLRTVPEPPAKLTELAQKLEEAPQELADKIAHALPDDPPREVDSAPVFRRGYDAPLDEALARSDELRRDIAELEEAERQRTSISNLRLSYNKVMGYYFEVSRGQLEKVPEDWRRRQTLTGGERFASQALDRLADQLLAADSTAADRQRELLQKLYRDVQDSIPPLAEAGGALAELDVLHSLASLARNRGYTRPSFNSAGSVRIVDGRHPVVETTAEFVPNDLLLEPGQRLAVVTGPNMAGKSVYLRQVALISLLAQLGSFVPAGEASLPVFDRVYTRVGATDAVADGLSTFMAEMQEAASILSEATAHSLVILDELGRGTSTHDGMSLAWSIARFLTRRVGCLTLFATHYRELASLADELPGVVNLHAAVREWEGNVVFLHRVLPGVAERSYGVHVARLAQLPEEILQEAQKLLSRLEQGGGPAVPAGVQLPLFGPHEHPVVARLREAKPDTLSPLEALQLVVELKEEVD